MQIRYLAAIIYLMFLSCSCKEKLLKSQQIKKYESPKQQSFFPVTEYILGQLKEIETLPVTLLKIITYKGYKDSIWMKKENIRAFAAPFLRPIIDSTNFKELFTEKSFLDQSINAFTFSYDPINKLPDTFQLRRWDVYIDAEKNTVKRIYLIKEINKIDGLQTLQLTWKSNQWCKITTITEKSGIQPEIKEELVKWDLRE